MQTSFLEGVEVRPGTGRRNPSGPGECGALAGPFPSLRAPEPGCSLPDLDSRLHSTVAASRDPSRPARAARSRSLGKYFQVAPLQELPFCAPENARSGPPAEWGRPSGSSLHLGCTCAPAQALLPRCAGKVEVNAATRWLRAEVGPGCRSLPEARVLWLSEAGRPDSSPGTASSEAAGAPASQRFHGVSLERFCLKV